MTIISFIKSLGTRLHNSRVLSLYKKRRDLYELKQFISYSAHQDGIKYAWQIFPAWSESHPDKTPYEIDRWISECGITEIYLVDGILHIWLRRPGIMIGVRGKDISTLESYFTDLSKRSPDQYPKFKSIKLHESDCELDSALHGIFTVQSLSY